MVSASSTVAPVLGGPRPAPTIRDKPWPCPCAAGRGLPSQFARVLEMPEPVLGLAPAPPAAGVIFTLFQVKLLRGRGTGDAIISCDISPRGGACWDDAAVPRPAAGDRGCSVPLSPAAVGAAGRWQEPGCSWLQLGVWPLFGAVWPRSVPCSSSWAGERRFPGAGEHGGGVGGWGGRQEGDLTAATAHFTACHALMAEEIKAGMELFIEINQSPRRRGENNIASSVIPGLQAAARPRGGCGRRCPGSQIRSAQALPVPGKAWPSRGWAACTFPGGVSEVGCNPTAPRSRIWGRMFGGASGLPCACDAPDRGGGKFRPATFRGCFSSRIRGRVRAAFTLLLGRGGG